MKIWVDAQLSPAIATWMRSTHEVEAVALRAVGLRDAEDEEIFAAARRDGVTAVMTKDRDFVDLIQRTGPPPQVTWVTCGNTSNARLREILSATLPDGLKLLRGGEPIVEIADSPNG